MLAFASSSPSRLSHSAPPKPVQGSIAQMAALTIHANALLRGQPPAAFWPGNTTLHFCRRVQFADAAGGLEQPYAADPRRWLERLRREGVTAVRLYSGARNDPGIPDRQSVAFAGGGGRWVMETSRGAVCDLWEPRWELGDGNDPEQRIWNVTYGRTATGIPCQPVRAVDLEMLRGELMDVLAECEAFAHEQQTGFADHFRAAIGALASDAPLAGVYHPDMAPEGALPLPARQLLGAVQHAWVFGGMGSWNDLGFPDGAQETYERLSDDLYALLTGALCAAANASAGAAAPQPSAPLRPAWLRRLFGR